MKKKIISFVLLSAILCTSTLSIKTYANTIDTNNSIQVLKAVGNENIKSESNKELENIGVKGIKNSHAKSESILITTTDKVESEETSPEVKATFSISGSITPNGYRKTSSTYYIKPGSDKLKIKSLSWSPTGQNVQVGFINASTGTQYWTSNYSGGSATGYVLTNNLPAGEYYVAVGTPKSNTKSVNVVANFDWQ